MNALHLACVGRDDLLPQQAALTAAAREACLSSFGVEPTHAAAASGRVNLIGDHVDYAGGPVLPMALALGTVAVVAMSADGRDRFVSCARDRGGDAYALGVLAELRAEGAALPPLVVAVASDLPIGAGLSSSAALEVAVARAALGLASGAGPLGRPASIARICQRAEHVHARVPCGIMDQWCVAHARPGEAIALECATCAHSSVGLPKGLTIEIVDSGVRHALRDGGYAARRADVECAGRLLGTPLLAGLRTAGSPRLRGSIDPSQEALDALMARADGRVVRRARHVLAEARRVRAAVAALSEGNLTQFGQLLVESHASLRDDFEVSVPELDRIVEEAVAAGALGARMTGGGFGGCAVVAWGGRRPEGRRGVLATISA